MAGGALGGVVGQLADIGALAIPGLCSFIVAGPIMATRSGATIGVATGALIAMGVPEFEAERYEGKIRGGAALIAAHADSKEEVEAASRMFEDAGGEDTSTSSEAKPKVQVSERSPPAVY